MAENASTKPGDLDNKDDICHQRHTMFHQPAMSQIWALLHAPAYRTKQRIFRGRTSRRSAARTRRRTDPRRAWARAAGRCGSRTHSRWRRRCSRRPAGPPARRCSDGARRGGGPRPAAPGGLLPPAAPAWGRQHAGQLHSEARRGCCSPVAPAGRSCAATPPTHGVSHTTPGALRCSAPCYACYAWPQFAWYLRCKFCPGLRSVLRRLPSLTPQGGPSRSASRCACCACCGAGAAQHAVRGGESATRQRPGRSRQCRHGLNRAPAQRRRPP